MMGWFSSDKCGNHHWGEWQDIHDIRFISGGMYVERRQRRHCLHECDETDDRWVREGKFYDRTLLTAVASLERAQQKSLQDMIENIQDKDEHGIEWALHDMLFGGYMTSRQSNVNFSIDGPGWSDDE